MTRLELYEKERELQQGYNAQLHELRMEYANLPKEYEVGDFVRCLSTNGIIKIEEVKYLDTLGIVSIMYCGYQYIFLQSQLLQNEYNEMTCFTHNIEKV